MSHGTHGMHDQQQENKDAGFNDQYQGQGFPEELDHDLSHAGRNINKGFEDFGNGIEHDFQQLGDDAEQFLEHDPNEEYGNEQGHQGQHSMQQDPYGMHDGGWMQNGHGTQNGHGMQHAHMQHAQMQHAQMQHDDCGGQSHHNQHGGDMEGHGGDGGYGRNDEDNGQEGYDNGDEGW